jgi:replication factor A1
MPIEQTYKIAELTPQDSLVNLKVKVIAKGARREIKRPTGETVKVSTLMVGDETGMLTLSLWDEKTSLVDELQEGESIYLRNVSIRDRLGELQLNLGRAGEIEKLSSANQDVVSKTKINALASLKGLATVQGTVIDQPILRQVVTQKGETIDVASFTLKDETGTTRVTLWREQVNLVKELQAGVRLQMVGVRVRSGLTGQMELSSVPLTKIIIIPST